MATYDVPWNGTRVAEALRAMGFEVSPAGADLVRGHAAAIETEARVRGEDWVLWVLANVPHERIPEDEVEPRAAQMWEERKDEAEAVFAG